MLRPFFENRSHDFRQKSDPGVLANAPYLLGPFAWRNERDTGQASRRGRNDPAAHVGNFRVDGHLETELINEKPAASLLISNPHRDKIQAEKRLQESRALSVTRNVLWMALCRAFHGS